MTAPTLTRNRPMATTLFPDLIAEPVNDLTIEDRNALVLSCERLCKSLARGATISGTDTEDLEQEALVVCCEAAKRWSPRLSVKFSTYATACIKRHLANLVTSVRCEGNAHLESWEGIEQPDRAGEDDESTTLELTSDQAEAVHRLAEPTRSAVLLVLDGISPDRIAAQLNLTVKDVKLMLRNAAGQLRRDLAAMDRPGRFTLGGDDDEDEEAA